MSPYARISLRSELQFAFHQERRQQKPLEDAGILTDATWDADRNLWVLPATTSVAQHVVELHDAGHAVETLALQRAKTLTATPSNPKPRTKMVAATATVSVLSEMTLRPYQVEARDFLVAKKHALLADDMGLGKTGTSLSALELAQSYPALVVVPAGLKTQWRRDAAKWIPQRSSDIINENSWTYAGQDIVIVNPERLQRVKDLGFTPKTVILDEAHNYKNPGADRSVTVEPYCADVEYLWFLTGTPMANLRKDLGHLLRLLGRHEDVIFHAYPKDGAWYRASKHQITVKDTVAYVEKMPPLQLHAAMKETCMMRRSRHDVAPDLPLLNRIPVVIDDISTEYAAAERELTNFAREVKLKGGYKNMEISDKGKGFGLLQRMRNAVARAKIPYIVDWAKQCLENGERAVIFTQFIENGHHLMDQLPGRKSFIHGEVDPARRDAIVRDFGKLDFMVASVGTSSQGVDGLHIDCRTVAFLDLMWTPKDHVQAEGRVNRGLEQKVQVDAVYFGAADTIDDAMRARLDAKFRDTAAVIDGISLESEDVFLGNLMSILIEQESWRTGKVPWHLFRKEGK